MRASAFLRRGRARETHAALDDARTHASRSGREELLIDVATLSGEAWIDLARLDEAEAVLSTAAATARELRNIACTAAVSMALARCLYWRGQYADASAALGPVESVPSAAGRMRHTLLAARYDTR